MARAVQQARHLRRVATRHEKKLWCRLRNRKLAGLKFRRQEPIEIVSSIFFMLKLTSPSSWTGLAILATLRKRTTWIVKSSSTRKALGSFGFTTAKSMRISTAF